jgi:hypothetical protein
LIFAVRSSGNVSAAQDGIAGAGFFTTWRARERSELQH